MALNICMAGVTGWAGSALTRAIHNQEDMRVTGAVSRSASGKTVQEALGLEGCNVRISESVTTGTLSGCNVMVEFTKPEVAKQNIMTALENGVHVVVGTSGLTDEDYAAINTKAVEKSLGVLAVGNFALTVVLLQKFAQMAAKYIPQWEIIDYAGDGKRDVPSGTARELAHRLAGVRTPEMTVPLDQTQGPKEARGATLTGTQVHSVRLPGYVIGAEVIFGMPDQRLSIRHDAGSSAEPYVDGALLAIRGVSRLTGVHRGLDNILDLS